MAACFNVGTFFVYFRLYVHRQNTKKEAPPPRPPVPCRLHPRLTRYAFAFQRCLWLRLMRSSVCSQPHRRMGREDALTCRSTSSAWKRKFSRICCSPAGTIRWRMLRTRTPSDWMRPKKGEKKRVVAARGRVSQARETKDWVRTGRTGAQQRMQYTVVKKRWAPDAEGRGGGGILRVERMPLFGGSPSAHSRNVCVKRRNEFSTPRRGRRRGDRATILNSHRGISSPDACNRTSSRRVALISHQKIMKKARTIVREQEQRRRRKWR